MAIIRVRDHGRRLLHGNVDQRNSFRGLRSDLLLNEYVLKFQQTKCPDASDTGYREKKCT